MTTHAYLYRRHSSNFYIRFTFPKDLHPTPPKKQYDIRLSLGTSDKQEAISLSGLLRYRFCRSLDMITTQLSTDEFVSVVQTIKLELKLAITSYHTKKCGMTNKKTNQTTNLPPSPQTESGPLPEDFTKLTETLSDTLDLIQQNMHPDLPRNEIEIEVEGKKVVIRHPDKPELELKHAKTLLGLGSGSQENKTPFHSVQAVFKQYIDNQLKVNSKANQQTLKEHLSMLHTVVKLLGADNNYYTLTLDDGEALVHKILGLKDGRSTTNGSTNTISKVRAKKILDKFKPVAKYAKLKRYNPEDIGAHLQIHAPKSKKSDEEATFSHEELSRLFAGYPYSQTPLKRERDLYDYHFWLIPILLYTGARLNEVCQLKVNNICQHLRSSELYYFDIKGEVKTTSSVRQVPIHPKLIELGFLDFVQQRRDLVGPEGMLFDGLYYSEKNKWGKKPSDWFNGGGKQISYRKTCQIDDSTQKNLHTFRHTFINQLKDTQGVEHAVISDLAGHEFGDQTSRYGKSHRSVHILMETLKQLDYDLDLSHLNYEDFKIYRDKKGKV